MNQLADIGTGARRKLLLTTSTLPRFEGDTEPRFVLDLALALSADYEVTLLAPAAPDAKLHEQVAGVNIIRYRYAPFRTWEALAYPGAILTRLRHKPWLWLEVPLLIAGLWLALLRLLKQDDFDLVHCHWFVPQGVVQAWGFSGQNRPPFVVTSHGGDLSALGGRLMRRLYARVLQRAGAITVVSEHIRSSKLRAVSDVQVIPMGVDLKRFGPCATQQIAAQRTDILFVGRLAEKKGVEYLLEAMDQPAMRQGRYSLRIVGDGPGRALLERRSRQLKLGGSVRFLGAVSHEHLSALYQNARVFCAPSVVADNGDEDGLPSVLLEASACGLPCVSTLVGGITDFIEHGVSGLLVEPGCPQALADAIVKLLDDQALCRAMGSKAIERASNYAWPAIADRFSAVYERVFASVREPI